MFSDLVERVAASVDPSLVQELREIEGRRREDAARAAVILASSTAASRSRPTPMPR